MRSSGSWVSLASLMVWAGLLGFIGSPVQAQCVSGWKPVGGLWGVNSGGFGAGAGVSAAAVYDDGSGPALYVAGTFTVAGDTRVRNIAKWTGTSWSPLGDGLGDDGGYVSALAVYNGALIAGGSFTTAGGVTANCIAKWTGTSWSPLGTGPNNGVGAIYGASVQALAVYDGALIVGGDFTTAGGIGANRLARWNGTSFSPLGSGATNGVDGTVCDLVVYNNALIVGGSFATAGGVGVNSIAQWNGVSFSPLGEGVGSASNSQVYALTVYSGALIAGGWFTTAGSVTVNHIARWDGTSWSPLGAGVGSDLVDISPVVHALAVYDGQLVAGGSFTTAGGVSASAIARWDGAAWSSLGSGIGDAWGTVREVWALTAYADNLIVGGVFDSAGGVTADNVAQWNGTSWSPLPGPLGDGTDGKVDCLTVYNGSLILGGWLQWDGSSFSPLGSGVTGGIGPAVTEVYNGNLIAGGWLLTAGGTDINNIAQWDGTSWSPLGSGPDNGVVGWFEPESLQFPGAFALTTYNDALIVGGSFYAAGGISAASVARWDGTTWSPLGGGVHGADGRVWALTVYNDDLIVGGEFTTAGGVSANNIARWDGTSWYALGGGLGEVWHGQVNALAVYNGNLVAAGLFLTAGGASANCIARWNGIAWSPLDSGADLPVGSTVNALAVYNGDLIVAGSFQAAGGHSVNNIARWTGSAWSAMGLGDDNGVNGPVRALTVYNGELIVGGEFTTAGGQVSYNWARWNPLAARFVRADFNSDCRVDDSDMRVFETCATGPGVAYDPWALPFGCGLLPDGQNHVAADLNADGFMDMADFAAFQRCWSGDRLLDPNCVD